MAYRHDPDLEFLQNCKNEDLDILVNYLTKDKDGCARLTEGLTLEQKYKTYYPDHKMYWELIAEELQRYGANTFVTLLRFGEGVLYKEILTDVCKRMKVNFNKNSKVEVIELNLLMKILEDSINKLNPEELKQVVGELNLKTTDFTKQGVIAALQMSIRFGGFAPYKLAVIVANSLAKTIIGKGLPLAINAGLTKSLAIFAGPIGWVLLGLWSAIDIAGPAYRVTIPAVVHIAYMRFSLIYRE